MSMNNWALVREESCGIQHCCFYTHEFWVRQQIRDRKGYAGDCCGDCCVLMFCGVCAICQDAREINHLNRNKIGSKSEFRKKKEKKPEPVNYAPPPAPYPMPDGFHQPNTIQYSPPMMQQDQSFANAMYAPPGMPSPYWQQNQV